MNRTVETVKINESFFYIKSNSLELKREILKRLTVEEKVYGAPWPKKHSFYRLVGDKKEPDEMKIMVPMGLEYLLSDLGISLKKEQEFSDEVIKDFIKEINDSLPFDLYDYQEASIFDSLKNQIQISLAATGAGKSAIVSLIAEFLRRNNKKILIIVPGISLVSQIHKDFLDYNLIELHSVTGLIGGDNNEKDTSNQVTISTWQSLQLLDKEVFKLFDAIIIDEVHKNKKDSKIFDIALNAINASFRIGLTGTMPEQKHDKMALCSISGLPKKYISSKELIKRGLGTNIKINSLLVNYNSYDKNLFAGCGKTFQHQLKYIEEHETRTLFISKLALSVSESGTTVLMTQHTQPAIELFLKIMQLKYPDVQVDLKNIYGKKAFEFQDEFNIFFINGSTDSKNRELIKKALEERDNCILISNYSLFSTGINIKKLANVILTSPLKSYVTITQTLGRVIRLHDSKDTANVYDIVDIISKRAPFEKQYRERKEKSYEPEGYEIIERTINF